MARLVVLVADRVDVAEQLAAVGGASFVVQRAGYGVARLDLAQADLGPAWADIQELSRMTKAALLAHLGAAWTDLVERRYWFPCVCFDENEESWLPLTFRTDDLDYDLYWDGGSLRARSDIAESALATIASALLHWYGVGVIGERARSVVLGESDDPPAVIRRDLDRSALLLDPRVDVYWQRDMDILKHLRERWSTAEAEDVANTAVAALDRLVEDKRAARVGSALLFVAVLSAVGLLPVLLDFAFSNDPLRANQVVRLIGAVASVAMGLGWWLSLRRAARRL